jgi:hypothetical protein
MGEKKMHGPVSSLVRLEKLQELATPKRQFLPAPFVLANSCNPLKEFAGCDQRVAAGDLKPPYCNVLTW